MDALQARPISENLGYVKRFETMTTVLLVLGLLGSAIMVISGFVAKTCPSMYALYGPLYEGGSTSFRCKSLLDGDMVSTTPDFGLVGSGIATALVLLWLYPLARAVAVRLKNAF